MKKKGLASCFAVILAVLMSFAMPAFAKQVTVKYSDLPFETAKQILLAGDRNLNGLGDDALQKILQNRGSLTFDDSQLPEGLRSSLQAASKVADVTNTLAIGKDWAQMGEAIGIATRGALSALTDETEKFAKTTPGIFIMMMVAWKVMGTDFLHTAKGYLVGIPVLVFWCTLFVWYLRRVYSPHYVTKYVAGEGGKLVKTREEVPALSVQWNMNWANALANAKEPDKMGTSEMVTFAGFKTAGFVIGIFVIIWGVI